MMRLMRVTDCAREPLPPLTKIKVGRRSACYRGCVVAHILGGAS
jgi:hypothetical protein